MLRCAILIALAVALPGCSTLPRARADSATASPGPSAGDKKIAADVAARMTTLYAPAKSKVSLRYLAGDAFGASLADALRKKGYALAEVNATGPAGVAGKAGSPAADLLVSYVVDQVPDIGLVRLTIFMNAQSLSRLYQIKEGKVMPAGYWVRKE